MCGPHHYLGRGASAPNSEILPDYYNSVRTHRSLKKDAPVSRPVQRTGVISSRAILGGLHHRYALGTHNVSNLLKQRTGSRKSASLTILEPACRGESIYSPHRRNESYRKLAFENPDARGNPEHDAGPRQPAANLP